MKMRFNSLFCLLIVGVTLGLGVQSSLGGVPGKPAPHSQGYRDANMLMLRFQNALAAEKWTEALRMCSDRIRAEASKWPDPGAFFHKTMPVEDVLAQSFGCWSCGEQAYGLVVDLTAPTETPKIQWFWAIVATNGSWVVDYPPVRLDEYVIKKKTALKQHDEEIARVRQELERKIQNLKVRLSPVSERFVVGSPMLFKLELVNSGKELAEYEDCGISVYPLKVRDSENEPVERHVIPSQVPAITQEIAPESSVVLAERIDLLKWYSITKPGKYYVQFDGSTLEIGKQMPFSISEPGLFGENEPPWAWNNFVTATTKLQSNVVEIEVVQDGKK